MDVQNILLILVVGGLCLVLLVAAWRFFVVRSQGFPILVRELPSETSHDWRHGRIMFNGDVLKCYKLRSLSPKADLVLDRRQTDFVTHRNPDSQDIEIVPEDDIVVEVDHSGTHLEFAVSSSMAKAVIAWVESAPSQRQERVDLVALRDRVSKRKKR